MSFSKPPNGFGGRHCKQCISPFCQRHPPVIQGHGLSQSGCQQQLILSKRMKFRMGMSWQKAVLGSKGKIILLLMQRYIYTYKKRNTNHLKLPTIKAFSYHSPDRGRRLNTNPITCQLRYWLFPLFVQKGLLSKCILWGTRYNSPYDRPQNSQDLSKCSPSPPQWRESREKV